MDKKTLREEMKGLRDSLKPKEKDEKDLAIYEALIGKDYYKAAKTIMIYVSMGSEVDTIRIINHALGNNKIICVPKVISLKDGMKAIEIDSLEELKPCGRYGILEPLSFEKEVTADKIDLFLIPGLAFDKAGGRIGYGAGFYDRFLKKASKDALKVGLAYDFQLINLVPMEERDIRLDKVIKGGCTE